MELSAKNKTKPKTLDITMRNLAHDIEMEFVATENVLSRKWKNRKVTKTRQIIQLHDVKIIKYRESQENVAILGNEFPPEG